MENLKIAVSNTAESKEAQELFFALGFKRSNGEKTPFLSGTTVLVRACMQMGISYIDSQTTRNYQGFINAVDGYIPVNMSQLRDLVVFHRNDPADATHTFLSIESSDPHRIYLDSDGKTYLFNGDQWVQKTYSLAVIKRIETLNDKVATAEVARKCSIYNMEAFHRVIKGLPVEFSHDGVKWYELTQEHHIYKLHSDIHFRIPPKKMEINGKMYDLDQAKDLIQRYFEVE